MMEYSISLSKLAENDLDEIYNYISIGLNNRVAAKRIYNLIISSIERLSYFPEMGASLNTISAEKSDYRFLVCGNYIVVYIISHDEIIIERIFYGKRDYLNILFNENTTGGE